MKYPCFSIRDNAVAFGIPFFDMSEQSAIRGFNYQINGDGVISSFPEDYSLYKIGEFDSDTGSFNSIEPKIVCSGSSLKMEKKDD